MFEFLKEFYLMNDDDVDDSLPCPEQKCVVKVKPELQPEEP